jgi:hypothetical protein
VDTITRAPGTDIALSAPRPLPWRGILPSDFDTSLRMAKVIAASGMAPRSYFTGNADPVAAVWAAIQLGAEVGLSPMSAVQHVAIINGRPGMFGPAMLAVVERSGLLADIQETTEGEGDGRAAVCIVTRIGRKPRASKFSVADAKRAKLWGKGGPWSEYPDRMLLARARTFALRDVFPDVLLGLSASVEELQEIPEASWQPAAAPEIRPVDAVPTPAPQEPPPAPCKPAVPFWERPSLAVCKPTASVETLIDRLLSAIPKAATIELLDRLMAEQPEALIAEALANDDFWPPVENARRARWQALMMEATEEAPQGS